MLKKWISWIAGVCFLAFLFAGRDTTAQEFRAVLTGQVTDPSGAVITKATITAVNVDSGTTYNGKTSDKGVYYIPYVLPGTYTVTAQANGFKTAVQDKVLLLVSTTFNQNFRLEIGSVNEHVEVNTAPAELETSTASNNTVLDQREIQNVPLNGGQAYTLIGTTPGGQFTQTQFGTGGYSGTRGWDVSNSYTIGGGIVGNNQFTLNGTNITSQFGYDNHSPGLHINLVSGVRVDPNENPLGPNKSRSVTVCHTLVQGILCFMNCSDSSYHGG